MTLAYAFDDPGPASSLTDVMDRLGVRMRFARNTEIYAQDDEVEFLYRVVSGSVRTIRLASDGRRQLGDFYYAGDVFGLEPGPDHRFSAEALSDSVVLVVKRSAVKAFAGEAELNRTILAAAHNELERTQKHLLLLGRKSARGKVAGFLMSLARRDTAEGFAVPMGRQDMADYLGLTIETVSRTLTQLQDAAVVEFAASRVFRVNKWDTLERLAE